MGDDRSVSTEVKRGSVVLVSSTVLPATVEDTCTFGLLLDKVRNSSADDSLELQVETVEKITISGATASSAVHVVPLNANGDKLRGDQRMYNDFTDLLGAMNIGWTPDLVGSVGEKCIKVAVSALWYIDPCQKQFVEYSIHFPIVFDQFQGYNDWKVIKH